MLWYFLTFIISLILIIIGLILYINGNNDFWPKRGVPLVTGSDVASILDQILVRIPFHELDQAMYTKFKSMGNLQIGGLMELRRPVLLILDLELVERILDKDFDHFTNRRSFGNKDGLFDKMLYNMDEPPWRETRGALIQTFTTEKTQRMFDIFNETGQKMVDYIQTQLQTSKDIEVMELCSRYSSDLIASAAFGIDSDEKLPKFAEMGQRFQYQFTGLGLLRQIFAILAPGMFTFFGLKFLDEISTNYFTDIVKKTMRHRDRTGTKRNDFLQLLMEARDKNTAVLTDETILAQCMLFFWAGFDTTEALLLYAAYELALHPEIQEKLAVELEKSGELEFDKINRLEYLDMVVSETLRKYPSAPRIERMCTRDYKIPKAELEIKKDTLVAISIWSIHHDPAIYPEPDKFIPERFSKENKAQRQPSAYLPFGVGPRDCCARTFALTAGKTSIAHLVRNYVIQPCSKTTIPIKYMTDGSILPDKGVWLSFKPRV